VREILLGHDLRTGKPVSIPKKAFQTHFHFIGGTGKGKTTAIHTLLHPLLLDPHDRSCVFIVDRIGNLSFELLLWLTSHYCTQGVRERVVYIEPAREDVVIGFNPLLHESPSHGYYKVSRATDVILRAWESMNIEAMPRLARWTFNAFWAAAQLGLTIADCVHFLMPGSPYHAQLLNCLPPQLKAEWVDIQHARSAEATRILESSRNRLKPYFESDILRRMFGATESRLDVLRFMRERKIVILNLAPQNRLSGQLSNAIGGLVLNEVLTTARSLGATERHPTYLMLDEFQNFVGPDVEEALPEVRQLGVRLILSHQSFAQLQRGDYDLTSMIFQAQSRMIFGVQGEDADLLAHELASLTFEAKRVKEELYSTRQRIKGHKIIHLTSWSDAESQSQQWNETYGRGWSTHEHVSRRDDSPHSIRGDAEAQTNQQGGGKGGGTGRTRTQGAREQLVPVHEEVRELASRTFYTFDEQKNEWAREIRKLQTGVALMRLVDDPLLYHVAVKRSTTGHLAWDRAKLAAKMPQVLEAVDQLIDENFRSGLFVAPEVIEAQTRERLARVLRPAIIVQSEPPPAAALPAPAPPADEDTFA